MIKLGVAGVLVAALALAGCSDKKDAAPQPSVSSVAPSPSATDEISVNPKPTDVVIPTDEASRPSDGELQSLLPTG